MDGIRKIGYYLGHILFGLLVSQLAVSDSGVRIIIGLVILLVHSYLIFNYLGDHYLFVIYIFSLCIMNTSDTLGGICLIPLLILLNYIRAPGRFQVKDGFVRIAFLIFVLTDFAGYLIKNPTDMVTRAQSVIIFSGFVLTFLFVQNLTLTRSRIAVIIKVVTYISFLFFAVAVNQKYVIIDTSIPILGAVRYPSVRTLSYAFYGRFPSLLGDYELFAEFSLLMFIMSFCIVMAKDALEHYKLGLYPYALLSISFINILMTGTRSGFILALLFVFIYFVFRFKSFFSVTTIRLGLIMMVAIPFILMFGDAIGLGTVLDRLREINPSNVSLENLRSGQEMNRDVVYAVGYNRLAQDDWILGYGFGRVASNKLAWFGYVTEVDPNRIIEDFHSLYLSLPMIYGWVGGLAYLSIIVYIIVMMFLRYLRFKDHPLGGVALGFAFMFLFFLLDQIKINSLRYYNYHLLIWILMAFALSFLRIRNAEDEDIVVY